MSEYNRICRTDKDDAITRRGPAVRETNKTVVSFLLALTASPTHPTTSDREKWKSIAKKKKKFPANTIDGWEKFQINFVRVPRTGYKYWINAVKLSSVLYGRRTTYTKRRSRAQRIFFLKKNLGKTDQGRCGVGKAIGNRSTF